jgi:hypothetical protein
MTISRRYCCGAPVVHPVPTSNPRGACATCRGKAMGRAMSADARSWGIKRSRQRTSWPLSLVLSVILHAGMIAGVVAAFWPAGVLIALGSGGDDPSRHMTLPSEQRLAGPFLQRSTPGKPPRLRVPIPPTRRAPQRPRTYCLSSRGAVKRAMRIPSMRPWKHCRPRERCQIHSPISPQSRVQNPIHLPSWSFLRRFLKRQPFHVRLLLHQIRPSPARVATRT